MVAIYSFGVQLQVVKAFTAYCRLALTMADHKKRKGETTMKPIPYLNYELSMLADSFERRKNRSFRNRALFEGLEQGCVFAQRAAEKDSVDQIHNMIMRGREICRDDAEGATTRETYQLYLGRYLALVLADALF